jgi:HTH-type transcriptional regulator/antitoxin HigA
MHEMAHVKLHLSEDDTVTYFDELNYDDPADAREREADAHARESMIPTAIWNASDPRILHTPDVIIEFANEMRISPAIVAGRIRYEFKKYQALGPLIGNRQVRKLFTEINWGGPNE